MTRAIELLNNRSIKLSKEDIISFLFVIPIMQASGQRIENKITSPYQQHSTSFSNNKKHRLCEMPRDNCCHY